MMDKYEAEKFHQIHKDIWIEWFADKNAKLIKRTKITQFIKIIHKAGIR